MLNRIKINFKYLLKKYIRILSYIFSAIGAIAIFISIDEMIPELQHKKIAIISILTFTLIVLIICYLFNMEISIRDESSKKFNIKYGDIFKDTASIKIISVNRCFDTIVNENLVSKNTLHGEFIEKYFESNIGKLDELIYDSLSDQKYDYENINKKDKKEGKMKRYPFGSIAEVKCGDTLYYLIALTEFNENLNAHYNVQQYTMVINSLMLYYYENSQGDSISISLLGSGNMSRSNMSKQRILEMLVGLIKINSDKIIGELNVIVYKDEKNDISIHKLL